MPVSLRSNLLSFTDPEDSVQLKALEECLASAFSTELRQEDKAALLEVFERFPEHDGLGVFWSILHGLEHVDGYERELVASIRRKPNLFNTLMLNRMLNAGIASAAGEPIDQLFNEVLSQTATPANITKQVHSFIGRREDSQR
jgi:hypothetical protein